MKPILKGIAMKVKKNVRACLAAGLMVLPLASISCTQTTPERPAEQAKSAAPAATPAKAAAPAPVPAKAGTTAANVAGKWSWTIDAGGNTISQSVVLKQDGEKLTGSFIDGFDDTTHEIKEGKIHDGQVSLTIVRPFMDTGELTLKFTGKVEGNSIKGNVEI